MKKDSGTDECPISDELLEILACPACEQRPPITLADDKNSLKCTECDREYPIRNGIPVLLVEDD